jgi:uncharacterized repeat protein (TIGR03847 family)
MNPSFDLGEVEAFTAGTVGVPGQRVFFLQARVDRQVVTLKCEKQQVAALGQFLGRLLQDLPAPDEAPLPTALELLDPVEPVWIAGQLGVAWEPGIDRFVVVVQELDQTTSGGPDEPDLPDEPDTPADPLEPLDPLAAFDPFDPLERATLRLELTRGQALAFCGRATELVAAGRPSCRFCGLPIDPDGHPCPRMN